MNLSQPLPVLMYHHISPRPGLVTCSPENFRAQMQWLAENRWKTLSMAEFSNYLQTGKIPPRHILLSFDDGYLDNWVHAHPVLQEFSLRATIFLITARIGDGAIRSYHGQGVLPELPSHHEAAAAVNAGQCDTAYLRWSEVEAMQQAGTAEFHSHTHSHTRWDQTISHPEQRAEALSKDLAASRHTLTTRLGKDSRHLCWPQGYYDASYQEIAQQSGFTHLYTTQPGVVRHGTDPLQIPRLVVKDKPAAWFSQRLKLYNHPWLSAFYLSIK